MSSRGEERGRDSRERVRGKEGSENRQITDLGSKLAPIQVSLKVMSEENRGDSI